jgi:hypothetical protein
MNYHQLPFWAILTVSLLKSEISHAETNQDIGLNVYEEISEKVLLATHEFSDEIGRLNDLNANAVSDIVFPKDVKISINNRLDELLTTYELALIQAQDTNSKIANQAQIDQCNQELEKFRTNVYRPLKSEVTEFIKLNADGNDKTEAVNALATALSIRCGISSSGLVTGTLSHCLIIFDEP